MTSAETVKIVLDAGTWTNYGSNPLIIIEDQDSRRGTKDVYISLKEIVGDIIYAFTESEIYSKGACELQIFTTNTTDRDNIFDDIKDIFQSSSESLIVRNPIPTARRNRHIYKMKVEKGYIK